MTLPRLNQYAVEILKIHDEHTTALKRVWALPNYDSFFSLLIHRLRKNRPLTNEQKRLVLKHKCEALISADQVISQCEACNG